MKKIVVGVGIALTVAIAANWRIGVVKRHYAEVEVIRRNAYASASSVSERFAAASDLASILYAEGKTAEAQKYNAEVLALWPQIDQQIQQTIDNLNRLNEAAKQPKRTP
jgi:hypothetical protein